MVTGFSKFFVNKLLDIRQSITSNLQCLGGHFVFIQPQHDGPALSVLNPTTTTEVRKVLTSTRLKPSPLDILPVSLLRQSIDVIAPVLAHMANLSFAQCHFPTAFKTAQVLPLLKKPGLDRSSMSNFRPISNLSTVSKVIERLILNRLKPHLHSSRGFCRLQSAYRSGHSTETALLHVMNQVYSAADEKCATALVALDISAAFDTINHNVLIDRLDTQFGVRDAVSRWLQSYLSDRKQFVKLGQHSSDITPCDSGVPQGSVLGPLLFTAYTSPVGDVISSHGVSYHTFADDTQLLVTLNTSDSAPALERLSRCSTAVRVWFLRNDLQLNAGKSEVMILGTPAQLRSASAVSSVDVAGSTLQVSSQVKSLGVILDSRMRFDSHVRAVVRACNYHTRALRHVRKQLTSEAAQTIACSVIGSRIDYCNSLLFGAPVGVIDKLQRAQNNVARVICQQRKRVSARPLLQSLHWLPIQERIRYKVALITYKALSTSVPPYLSELLQCQETTRSLRSTDALRLFVPRTRTETAKRAFSVAAPNVWNSLPIDIRNTDCLSTFRSKLKTHFFTASYT